VESAAEERFRRWADGRVNQLHRTAYLLCGDWHLAEDLVQESLAKAYLNWGKVESAEKPDAYVWRILINQVKSRGRRRSGSEAPVEHPPHRPVADGAQDRADRAELMAAIRQLPSRQRAALVFRYFEQLSEAETADALGCSVGNVKSQTSRALRSLRHIITTEAMPC
jgi:RNA polymerase sigma-70 factor (sigma-E family)